MGNFLKSAKFRIIVCILALLVGVMIYALTMGGYTISTVGVFRSIAAPFQRASNAISSRVEYILEVYSNCLLYTSPSPRDLSTSRMPSSA